MVELELSDVKPCVAGPKRPQDKISLADVKAKFSDLLETSGKNPCESVSTPKGEIKNGSVLIAAITSCTNTSNPSVMVAAGLVAKRRRLWA